jgi:surfeit locus 1 family protein
MILERMFSRQWWKTTVLVVIAVAVMIRLGIWQLDRLEQRRAFNTRVESQLAESPLELVGENLNNNLYDMEYRSAVVSGEFDFQNQVVLRNQDWNGQLGVHLLTPLLIAGAGEAVLVDRGWVPYADYTGGNISRYDTAGQVRLEGMLRRSQSKPAIGGRADAVPGPGEAPLKAWNWINLGDISGQLPYPLLPVYMTAAPIPGQQSPPYRAEVELDLTEGSHLGYAFQWFAFAAILGIGYPFYIRREENRQLQKSKRGTPYIQSSSEQPSAEQETQGYEQA